jgi:hypothetical protein
MKKYARILVAATFLLGFSAAANAEIRGEVVVKLPFGFVASSYWRPPRNNAMSSLLRQAAGANRCSAAEQSSPPQPGRADYQFD